MNNMHSQMINDNCVILMTSENNIQRKVYNELGHYAVEYEDCVK